MLFLHTPEMLNKAVAARMVGPGGAGLCGSRVRRSVLC